MTHRLINILLFCGVIACMFGIQALDNNSAEQEVARQELFKHQKEQRFKKAASEMCGNGTALVDQSGAVVCRVRKSLTAGVKL